MRHLAPRFRIRTTMAVALACPAAAALAQIPNQNQSANQDPAAWLAANAVPMTSIDRVDGDEFADLAGLADAIGDARIVMLGEQTHGDGAAFLAKTRLIAFLHERMGFDVLCFESGMYDGSVAWTAIAAGTPARPAMQTAIFPIWMRSQQVGPLVAYLQARARTDRPLELAGYDCQFTGSASQGLPGELEAMLAALGDVAANEADGARTALATLLGGDAVADDGELEPLRRLVGQLRDPAVDATSPAAQRQWWAQVLESVLGQAAYLRATSEDDGAAADLAALFNPRDEQGARNLAWLALNRYPGRRIIVWAASMHVIRDHGAIDTMNPDLDYTGVRSMGDCLSDMLGEDDVFVIAPTALTGRAGLPWADPWPLADAPAGSLEAWCHAAGLQNAIVPLRGRNAGTFLDQPILARPLGHAPMQAIWPRHVDAFLFQARMTPSTPFRTEAEVTAVADIFGLLDARATSFRASHRAERPFADKGDFAADWQAWEQVQTPSDVARTAIREQVATWAAGVAEDPTVGWRAAALLGFIDARAGELGAAIAQYDRALELYVPRKHRQPRMQSARQHLVNARALALWDREGFDVARAWLIEQYRHDHHLRYFHDFPWWERLPNAATRAALLADIGAALEARIAEDASDAEVLRRGHQSNLDVFAEINGE